MDNAIPSVSKVILIPGLITLGVTVVRLIGELQQWSEVFFRRSAGGFGAVVGITWLAVIFAIYFAVQLQKAGNTFERSGKAIGLSVLALVLCFGGLNLMFGETSIRPPLFVAAGIIVELAGLYIMRMVWPAYWNVMTAYALVARIPVIAVMYLATQGNWGTHYDVESPGMQFTGWLDKFIRIGLIPQLFLWIPYTVVLCGLFGVITAAVRKRRTAAAPP